MSMFQKYWELPLYQKINMFSRLYALLKTKFYYAVFLRECGVGTIVSKPLLWTPEYISLGDNVRIGAECRIQAIPRYRDQHFAPHIQILDDVTMEQGCHIASAGNLVIGKGVTLSSYVMIQSVDHQYKQIGVDILHQELMEKETLIGKNCFIGAGAKVLAGTKLGEQCIVGANAVVKGVFPSFCVIAGAPARIIKKYSEDSQVWVKVSYDD